MRQGSKLEVRVRLTAHGMHRARMVFLQPGGCGMVNVDSDMRQVVGCGLWAKCGVVAKVSCGGVQT